MTYLRLMYLKMYIISISVCCDFTLEVLTRNEIDRYYSYYYYIEIHHFNSALFNKEALHWNLYKAILIAVLLYSINS